MGVTDGRDECMPPSRQAGYAVHQTDFKEWLLFVPTEGNHTTKAASSCYRTGLTLCE